MKSLLSTRRSGPVWVVYALYCVLMLHACYVTMLVLSTSVQRELTVHSLTMRGVRVRNDHVNGNRDESGVIGRIGLIMNGTELNEYGPERWPELFIFRRTKKTGSSSMMNALMDILQPLGYRTLPFMFDDLEAAVRNEFRRERPRRTMVLHQNFLTRNVHPARRAVIADTIFDGYKQVTSYCRDFKRVKTCDGPDMEHCLRSSVTLLQNTYRWAFRKHEDSDTYIDLPLSAAHPALSTTVLRTVFQNATLRVNRYDMRETTCPDNGPLRPVYDNLYVELDGQVKKLKKRILVIAGYPYIVDPAVRADVSLVDMLDAAERIEREKYKDEYDFESTEQAIYETAGKAKQAFGDHLSFWLVWYQQKNGSLSLVKEQSHI